MSNDPKKNPFKKEAQRLAKEHHEALKKKGELPQQQPDAGVSEARRKKAEAEAEAKQPKKKAGGKAKKPRTPAQIEATRKLVEFNKARKNKQ